MSTRAGGGEGVPHEGDILLATLLSLAFCLGAVVGAFTCNWVGKLRGKSAPRKVVGDNRWARLTGRALRFLRRRRAIALAFNHLGSYGLRPSEGSRPNQLRQRRASTPASGVAQRPLRRRTPETDNVLHEGPAIRNGPNGR